MRIFLILLTLVEPEHYEPSLVAGPYTLIECRRAGKEAVQATRRHDLDSDFRVLCVPEMDVRNAKLKVSP